jgi:hypothetical protein
MSDEAPEPMLNPNMAERRWLWRRLYVFAVSLGVWALVWRAVGDAPAADQLAIVRGLVALQALVLTLYLVAPTAQQIVELLARLRLRMGG